MRVTKKDTTNLEGSLMIMSWKEFQKAVIIYCQEEGCDWNSSPERITCLLNAEDYHLVEGKCPEGHPLWVKITIKGVELNNENIDTKERIEEERQRNIMYILYEKGVRVWGVGHTPMIARKEAEDHGANIYGKTIKVLSSGKKGDFCLKTCTLGVFNWYINSLYPEEFVWEEREDGVLQLPGEDSQDGCPKCQASHAAEDI